MKRFLMKLLGLTELNTKIDSFEKHIATLERRIGELKELNKLLQVGVDINLHSSGGSWAVICVAGRAEYVRFVRLAEGDAVALRQFLQQFSPKNRIVNIPDGMFRNF